MSIKPGWILLGLLLLLSFYQCSQVTTLRRQVSQLRYTQTQPETPTPQPAPTPAQLAPTPAQPTPTPATAQPTPQPLSFRSPLPGACVPRSNTNLPGAARSYRRGTSPGFVFTADDACTPVRYGTAVLATADGVVTRAETTFQELSTAEFRTLLRAVAGGANPEQMNRLRGREVWLRHSNGTVSVYAHLSAIAPEIGVGSKVSAGQWIGRVGNSGTEPAVQGSRDNPRLLFELWDGQPDRDKYFGQNNTPAAVRAQGVQRFGLLPTP